MKKMLSWVLVLSFCLPILLSCGQETSGTKAPATVSDPSAATTAASPETGTPAFSASEEPEELKWDYGFGVYTIQTADGEHTLYKSSQILSLDGTNPDKARFTIHPKTKNDQACYAIYFGDDEVDLLAITSFLPDAAELKQERGGYDPKNIKNYWTFEAYEDGTCRIVPFSSKESRPICLAVRDGKVVVESREDDNPGQLFRIEKAGKHSTYREFASKGGNIFVRIHKNDLSIVTGITEEFMQEFADHFQEAYEAEIELTGYIPYDVIVVSGWENLGYVAGVSDNYHVINANRGFMREELVKSVSRKKNLNIFDLSFGLLHELGHMFDSGRGWNFESEAWTDLKLCYVLYKLTEDHKNTDGTVFGCASSDYGASRCFTYETMTEGLDIHKSKGAMTTVYGFFGAAKLFLDMTYDPDFGGWEPFIQTFHWFQDNGYTQNSFDRWTKFTTFVEKLSEFSGQDVKSKYLTEENWEVFRRYYQEETKDVV